MSDHIERMGMFPCFKWPEKTREDHEFEYFKVRVPRHHIRMHIAEGGKWPGYRETTEQGEYDESVVLGVIWLPGMLPNPEPLDADADFVYYELQVPKEFLDTYIMGGNVQYRILYETQAFKLENAAEKAEREAAELEEEHILPAAGASFPGRDELDAMKRAKKTRHAVYEIELRCNGFNESTGEPCNLIHCEVTSDLFEALSGRVCGVCGSTSLTLAKVNAIVREEEDD